MAATGDCTAARAAVMGAAWAMPLTLKIARAAPASRLCLVIPISFTRRPPWTDRLPRTAAPQARQTRDDGKRSAGRAFSATLGSEGGFAGDSAAQDEGVDVVRPFIGVDRLQVHGVAHDVQLAGDPGPAVHVAGLAGDGQGLAAVVALHQADGLGNPGARVQQTAQSIGALEAEEDLGLH